MRRHGFSLLEVVIACALFGGLTTLIFSFFRFGTHAFMSANQRHGLQMDALRCADALTEDLERSSQASVSVLSGATRSVAIDTETVQRDVISFASIKNWRDHTNSENYNLDNGAPLWNRSLVYYATQETEGRFIRLRVDPIPPPETATPLLKKDLDKLHGDDPTTNVYGGETPPFAVLARTVYAFKVGALEQGSYPITLKLRTRHVTEAVEPGARRPFDYYQLDLRLAPENGYRASK